MDPIKAKALELAIADGGQDAGAVARAEAYERFLRGEGVKSASDADSLTAVEPLTSADDGGALATKIFVARMTLTDTLALEPPGLDQTPPTLRDMLDAGLPEWLAVAGDREMRRQAGLVRNTADIQRHAERWSQFVRSAARQAGATNGVRFPPDL